MNPSSHLKLAPARALAQALAALILASSCGTLFFPERKGQPSGKMDPNILVLDASLLIFWIVPGVVAFVVDFYTHAAYLPPGRTEGEGPLFGEDALFELRVEPSLQLEVEVP